MLFVKTSRLLCHRIIYGGEEGAPGGMRNGLRSFGAVLKVSSVSHGRENRIEIFECLVVVAGIGFSR